MNKIIHLQQKIQPALNDDTLFLPGLSPVGQHDIHAHFDGGALSSDGGVLLLREIERGVNFSGMLASCLHDARDHDASQAGASEREIMAWTGHTSPKIVQIYAGKARRGIMADSGYENLRKNETGSEFDESSTKGSSK